jgi:hypothetical protein
MIHRFISYLSGTPQLPRGRCKNRSHAGWFSNTLNALNARSTVRWACGAYFENTFETHQAVNSRAFQQYSQLTLCDTRLRQRPFRGTSPNPGEVRTHWCPEAGQLWSSRGLHGFVS